MSKPHFQFTKMVASGNDFIVIRSAGQRVIRLKEFAKIVCDRKYGAGADGLLFLEKSKSADVRMRIFNADGTEAEMCGNGARCTALYVGHQVTKSPGHPKKIKIQTKAGIIDSEVNDNVVKIKLTDPKGIRLDIPLKAGKRNIKVNFIDTGVPHAVIFTEGLDNIDVFNLGKFVRFHKQFSPRGTNVDFVEVLGEDSIKVRTYERGVEDETLACGTGSVASALIFAIKAGLSKKVSVHTRSKEILSVSFLKENDNFENVCLEGQARIVYEGDYYV